MLSKKKLDEVMLILNSQYPDAKAELDFTTPYELLIATMLSAQCTDIRVNKVTKVLFKRANTPQDMVDLGIKEIEKVIKPCGIYKNKAKNIYHASEILALEYKGQVPEDISLLIQLPGVGRKTANVVVSNAFGIPAIAVDTHVFRVTNRIGIVKAENVDKTEQQLMKRLKKETWTKSHHVFIFHGRRICKARKPLCEACPVKHICIFKDKTIEKE